MSRRTFTPRGRAPAGWRRLRIEALESRYLLSTAPSFTEGPNVVVNSNVGTVTQPAWATNISAGSSGDSDSQLTFTTAAGPTWDGNYGNAQHTAISSVPAASLDSILWQTPVDLDPQYSDSELLIHYGSPVITQADTVIVPVKTGASDGFELNAFNGANGSALWSLPTDYWVPPGGGWVPSYSPVMTPEGRLYFAGDGGTVYYVNNPDSPSASVSGQIAFFGNSNYQANESAYDQSVYICTPLTSDAAGNIYFGFVVTGSTPLGLVSGIARIGGDGSVTYISASAAAGGDASITKPVYNSAPAVSNDGTSIYVAVSDATGFGNGDLVKLSASTLAYQASVALTDPKSGQPAYLPDQGTASPTVGPDGDVYMGVLEDPFPSNNDRGWLLHFSGDLSQEKTPGAFGWDDTASIVPASAVPSYHGSSSYLVLSKYNDYAGIGSGDGDNRVAILDPDTSMTDPISGATVMNEVLSIEGVTPDPDWTAEYPGAVREWCINSAVVDPATDSAFVGSEDGKLYRWDLATNTFSQVVTLTSGLGEAYTPTMIGPNGTVYAINNATLFAVGSTAEPQSTQLLASPPTIDPTTGNLSFSVLPGASGTATYGVTLADSGGDTSSPQFFTITVVPPPVVNVGGGPATFVRDSGEAVAVTPDLDVADISDSQLLTASVEIDNLLDGTSEVLAANTTGTQITATYDSASGVLSLSGPDSPADYQQVLATVTYLDTSPSASITTRTLSIVVNDSYGPSTSVTQSVVLDVAPTVVGAYVNGSAWNASYLSMLDAAGLGSSAASGQGFQLADGADQLTTMLPWTNITLLSIAFSEFVNVSQGSLTLYDSTNAAIASSGFSYNNTANIATWQFAMPLAPNKYVMNLAASLVTDTARAELDGAWTTSVSTFAAGSGNGAPDSDFNFYFNVLPGDVNNSGTVTNGDVLITKLQVGAVSNSSNYLLDVNASSNITNGDVLLEKLQVGSNINSFSTPQLPPQFVPAAASVEASPAAVMSDAVLFSPAPPVIPISDGQSGNSLVVVSPAAALVVPTLAQIAILPPADDEGAAAIVLPPTAVPRMVTASVPASPDSSASAPRPTSAAPEASEAAMLRASEVLGLPAGPVITSASGLAEFALAGPLSAASAAGSPGSPSSQIIDEIFAAKSSSSAEDFNKRFAPPIWKSYSRIRG